MTRRRRRAELGVLLQAVAPVALTIVLIASLMSPSRVVEQDYQCFLEYSEDARAPEGELTTSSYEMTSTKLQNSFHLDVDGSEATTILTIFNETGVIRVRVFDENTSRPQPMDANVSRVVLFASSSVRSIDSLDMSYALLLESDKIDVRVSRMFSYSLPVFNLSSSTTISARLDAKAEMPTANVTFNLLEPRLYFSDLDNETSFIGRTRLEVHRYFEMVWTFAVPSVTNLRMGTGNILMEDVDFVFRNLWGQVKAGGVVKSRPEGGGIRGTAGNVTLTGEVNTQNERSLVVRLSSASVWDTTTGLPLEEAPRTVEYPVFFATIIAAWSAFAFYYLYERHRNPARGQRAKSREGPAAPRTPPPHR